jgi:hypothetical protein
MMRKLVLSIAFMGFIAFPMLAEAALINGGFEDDFLGWTTGGFTAVVTEANLVVDLNNPSSGEVTFVPNSGEKMALISYPNQQSYIWNNYILQDIILEPDDNYLNLYYNAWTYDEVPFDTPAFLVEINDETVFSLSAGEIGGDDVLGTLDYTGWTLMSIDLSDYFDESRPVDIRISFNAGNTGDNEYISGVFLDGMSVTEYPVPIPPTVLLLGSGLLVFIRLKGRMCWQSLFKKQI